MNDAEVACQHLFFKVGNLLQLLKTINKESRKHERGTHEGDCYI